MPSHLMAPVRPLRVVLALLTLASALSACGLDADVIGTPEVRLAPQQLVFARQPIGTRSERRVEVANIGSAPLLIAGVRLEFDDPEAFALYYQTRADGDEYLGLTRDGVDHFDYPIRLDAGDALYLALEHEARDERPADGRIVLETNRPDAPELVIPVELNPGAPQIDVNPRQHDFGRVPAGEHAEIVVEVTNIGQLDLSIDDIRLDGDPAFRPLVELDGALVDVRHTLGDGPAAVLAPEDKLDLIVRYAPRVEGPGRAELVISSDDPDTPEVVVSLAANGALPCLRAAPAAVEFRTSLVDRADSRPLTIESCGGGPVEITRIYLRDADPAFSLAAERLPALPAVLPAWAQADRDAALPPPSLGIEVAFTPREERIHNGTLVIESTDPANPRLEVPLLGRGVTNACPQARAAVEAFEVAPLDVVVLDGSPSIDQDGQDGRPVSYEWVITSRPPSSLSQPREAFFEPGQPANGGVDDDPATSTAVFFVDYAGTYVAELRVRDRLGLDSIACQNPAVVTIVARPDEALHIQLSWRTPGDDDETDDRGTDLDLHLLNPLADAWFAAPYDCHYGAPVPDWGQPGDPSDDPSLDIDDVNGAGPENINLDRPQDTDTLGAPYLVGVHYYASSDRLDGTDYGASFATVRVFIDGELAWDYEGAEKELRAADHFWDVAQITWPAREVVTRDRYYEARP